nr:DUF1826 domain-containing protein [Oceanococcus sp. HetDA_MAG_MS8]
METQQQSFLIAAPRLDYVRFAANRGPGTQYGVSTDGSEPRRVFSVPTGAPVLVRGTHWPEPPMSGLLHRSPPMEGLNQARFVLVLDPFWQITQKPVDLGPH